MVVMYLLHKTDLINIDHLCLWYNIVQYDFCYNDINYAYTCYIMQRYMSNVELIEMNEVHSNKHALT